ncbi:MAG TPA: tetratricopeptide repeat protein, partial [Bacteroidia bacterium]|nr:tetratricopeptide repeat protein [Bacteroidia bacterium]
MRHIYLLFFSVLIYGTASAQDKGVSSGDFSAGNSLLLKNNYAQALQSFSRAYTSDSLNANLNYKIGRCYIGMEGKKELAVRYFEKAVKNITLKYNQASVTETAAPENAYYYLGIAYHAAYKFGEAINSFKTFRLHVVAKDSLAEIDHRIEQSENARMFTVAPNSAKVISVGDSINSIYSDFNALLASDESFIIFTSDRPVAGNNSDNNGNTASIYISYRKNDTCWGMPHLYDKTLNNMPYT